MAILQSKVHNVTDSKSEISIPNTKALMPIGGTIYLWYGSYAGTSGELMAEGMPIPDGKLLEHVHQHTGVITVVVASGTVKLHEVL